MHGRGGGSGGGGFIFGSRILIFRRFVPGMKSYLTVITMRFRPNLKQTETRAHGCGSSASDLFPWELWHLCSFLPSPGQTRFSALTFALSRALDPPVGGCSLARGSHLKPEATRTSDQTNS